MNPNRIQFIDKLKPHPDEYVHEGAVHTVADIFKSHFNEYLHQ